MTNLIIYHNPRCSKSRQTLEIINNKGVEVEIIDYQQSPPTKTQLKKILKSLNLPAQEIMRKKEADYIASGLNDLTLTEDAQLDLLIAFPKVMERPIVVKGNQAVIGRPPENVLQLL